MKQSILRTICASILMAIAMGITIGIFAAAKGDETVYVWQSVTFASTQAVELYAENGEHLQTVRANDEGRVVSRLLPQGRYYAFSGEACVEFELFDDRSVRVVGGCGWSDGGVLHLTKEPVGRAKVEFLANRAGFYTFTLICGEKTHRKTVCAQTGQTVMCEFSGLSFGTYMIFLDQKFVTRICVNDKTPLVAVALAQ